jgi:hypothetical protein
MMDDTHVLSQLTYNRYVQKATYFALNMWQGIEKLSHQSRLFQLLIKPRSFVVVGTY